MTRCGFPLYGAATQPFLLWRLNAGEPYVRKVPVRFGGRGGSRPSLPLSRRRFISRDGVVPKPRTTPSARNKVASRLFIDRAATPPNLGGEFLFGCFTT